MKIKHTHRSKKFLHNTVSGLFVFILALLPITIQNSHVQPLKAEAVWPTFDGANVIQNTITAIESVVETGLSNSLVTKEYVLDLVVWPLVNSTLEGMLQSTINWVNSGFEGKPMYITNLRGFMTDVTDYVAEDFLMEHLNFLCTPYMADIKLALEFNYREYERDYEVQCRLSDSVDNLEGFISGDFINAGGWDTWYEVALNPSNNIYGSLIEAESALSVRSANVNNAFAAVLNRTGNFLDLKKCDDDGKNCDTITPGAAINHQLNTSLDIPTNRLTIADEIDELIGALFSQLVSKALDPSGGGVRGLGQSSGPNGSYFDNLEEGGSQIIDYSNPPPNNTGVQIDADAIRDEATAANAEAAANAPGGTANLSALEEEYLTVLQEAASVIRLCDGKSIMVRVRNELDDYMTDIGNKIASMLSGSGTVSSGEVSVYKNSTLPGIVEKVENAGCN